MIQCPKCGMEIRYIAGAPSSGKPGEPIAVDIKSEILISESGRRMIGFREHRCPEVKEEKNNGK
jgi:hypothetical protein